MTVKYHWRVAAKATASKEAKNYIKQCGSSCVVYCKTAAGALRMLARFSMCRQSEFVVIGS